MSEAVEGLSSRLVLVNPRFFLDRCLLPLLAIGILSTVHAHDSEELHIRQVILCKKTHTAHRTPHAE